MIVLYITLPIFILTVIICRIIEHIDIYKAQTYLKQREIKCRTKYNKIYSEHKSNYKELFQIEDNIPN